MRTLSDTARSDSFSQTSSQAGDIAAAFTGQDYYRELINQANSVPILKIFKHYRLRLDSFNRKITCPFSKHQGGSESTPSFQYYPDTNSFFCFGCRVGGPSAHGVRFVAEKDGCTYVQAARRILETFGDDVDDTYISDPQNFSERLDILMELSQAVREFCQTFPGERALVYVEGACASFDALHAKELLDNNEALRRAVALTKDYIGDFQL